MLFYHKSVGHVGNVVRYQSSANVWVVQHVWIGPIRWQCFRVGIKEVKQITDNFRHLRASAHDGMVTIELIEQKTA